MITWLIWWRLVITWSGCDPRDGTWSRDQEPRDGMWSRDMTRPLPIENNNSPFDGVQRPRAGRHQRRAGINGTGLETASGAKETDTATTIDDEWSETVAHRSILNTNGVAFRRPIDGDRGLMLDCCVSFYSSENSRGRMPGCEVFYQLIRRNGA